MLRNVNVRLVWFPAHLDTFDASPTKGLRLLCLSAAAAAAAAATQLPAPHFLPVKLEHVVSCREAPQILLVAPVTRTKVSHKLLRGKFPSDEHQNSARTLSV